VRIESRGEDLEDGEHIWSNSEKHRKNARGALACFFWHILLILWLCGIEMPGPKVRSGGEIRAGRDFGMFCADTWCARLVQARALKICQKILDLLF